MNNKVIQTVLAAVLAAGFVAPALAQNSNWKLNSDHSTGRLSLSSTADSNATLDVGIARVKGSVNLDGSSLSNSSFDFMIYPADQDPASINKDGSLNAAEFSNVARSTVVTFRSREVRPTGDGDLAVTGNLTLTHLERPFTITLNEAYAGPVYGEPEVHSATREVTFVFDHAAAAAAQVGNGRKLKLAVSATINTEDFPGLFEVVTGLNWPVVVEDADCKALATIGEEYHGTSCTGTPVVVSSGPSASFTIGEDYPGPDPDAPRVRDNVSIVLNLELTRDTSVAVKAAGY